MCIIIQHGVRVFCVFMVPPSRVLRPASAPACMPQTFFERMYMGKTSGLYGRAVDNFVRSLAGYAIVTYMLQARFCTS